jgi:hypothetical protein
MTFSNINVSTPNSGLGDKLRDAFVKVNDNFALIGDIVTPEYLSATLSSYATIEYVDDVDTNLQNQITSLGYLVDLGEGSIQALQTDVTNLELLVDGKASLTQLNNSIANINSTIAALQIVVDNKIGEAPSDDKTYGRRNENWEEITGGSSTYKVYSAIVNQSGEYNVIEIDNTNGDLVIGRTYQIIATDSDSCNFTNVGAPRNDISTYFVATGTTPTSWGNDNKARLQYVEGAPVVNVLENTIGDIVWIYDGTGFYMGYIFDAANRPIPTFLEGKTPTLNYITGPMEANIVRHLVISRGADEWVRFEQYNTDFNRVDEITEAFIEIRVYN